MRYLTIGKLGDQAGVARETIRYYERIGLLGEPDRLHSGYRVYDTTTVKRIRFIKEAQALGFTLSEIAELVGITDDESAECAMVNAKALQKLEDIDVKIKALKKMKQALTVLSKRCPADEHPLSDCSIINHLYGKEN